MSERFVQEIVLAMGEAVLEPIKEEIQYSPDETTDVSIIKHYGRYISNGETKIRHIFLG